MTKVTSNLVKSLLDFVNLFLQSELFLQCLLKIIRNPNIRFKFKVSKIFSAHYLDSVYTNIFKLISQLFVLSQRFGRLILQLSSKVHYWDNRKVSFLRKYVAIWRKNVSYTGGLIKMYPECCYGNGANTKDWFWTL